MAQPQSQVPPRAFSPPQASPSPGGSQPGFALPPNKRVKTEGPASQPGSPYPQSPYGASPMPASTPPVTAGSPPYAQTPPVHPGYATPYTNGQGTPGYAVQDSRQATQSPMHTPQPLQHPQQVAMPQYTNATMVPIGQHTPQPMQQNVMGPPQRPADRPTKDYEYDVTDSLAGTGIDLRAEEQYMSELYSTAMEGNAEARTGFAVHTPGGASSFYGAGAANQEAEQLSDQKQKEFELQAAERAWQESSMRLAMQRTQEIADPFLLVAILHRKADKIARDHHLDLNLELRNNAMSIGKLRVPEQFPTPTVNVRSQPGPDSTLVQTSGSWIPQEAYLVDQFALLSIATKQRLRELVEDANGIACNRQKTSHGDIPEEWSVAAAPMNMEPLEPIRAASEPAVQDGELIDGSGEVRPLKRPNDELNGETSKKPKKMPKVSSLMTTTMRELAKQEREWEEARLRRRQKRKEGTADSTSSATKAGSAAPGTPGSVAPEGEKGMTKKELKKSQQLKQAEANSHMNQNMTSSMFAGLGGKTNLFGKNKKAKTYDWMNVGRGSSGTSTPTKGTPGGGKGTNGAPAASPGAMALTTEGRNRLGTWREDKEKGKNIQLRDWVAVLERDGREGKALQQAYLRLDSSNPK